MRKPSLQLGQGLLQVGDDVLGILQTGGQADQTAGDAGGGQLLLGIGGVGHGGGMLDQRLGVAQGDGHGDQMQGVDQLGTGSP